MATTIIGVDFSGAWYEHKTLVAQGLFSSECGLRFVGDVTPYRRMELIDLIAGIQPPAVIAMDFPFGVPAKFARYIRHDAARMPDIWATFYRMHAEEFISARHQFVDEHGESKRAGDHKYHRESYSPLHTVNPVMTAMTYAGTYLLHRLHQTYPNRWNVPPLPPPANPDDVATLLEVMPGAFLRAIGLPFKGYKNSAAAISNRDKILDGLSKKSGVPLPNLATVRSDCRANDDRLDAVVAAVAAAAWAKDSSQFRHPDDNELADAQLEGWLYAPKPQSNQS